MNQPVKRNENGYRIGESHHRAKLTDREIELARQLHDGGMSVTDVANKMDISKGYASKILSHRQR